MLRFFALTYAVTWTCFVVSIALSGSAPSFVSSFSALRTPLLILGTFAPSLVALGLTARAEGVCRDAGPPPPRTIPVAVDHAMVSVCRRLSGRDQACRRRHPSPPYRLHGRGSALNRGISSRRRS